MKNFITMIMMITLCVTNAQTWTNYTAADGLIEGVISEIIQDNDGNMWFTEWTDNLNAGIGKFDGTNWTQYDESIEGLSSNTVRALLQDSSNNFWFGTFLDEAGLVFFDGTTWITYTAMDGLLSNDILDLIEDSEGNIWIATTEGISKFDGNSFTTILNSGCVYSIIEDTNGDFWFGTCGFGVIKYDGVNFVTYTTVDGLGTNSVFNILQDNDGNYWFGDFIDNTVGVTKFNGEDDWTIYNTEDGLVNNNVREIILDNEGNIWFGTNGGVSKFDGTTWVNYTEADGLISNFVRAITQDSDGAMWIGTFFGVSKFDATLGFESVEFTRLKTFPNPTKGVINFEPINSNITSVKIYDLMGNLVLNKQANQVLDIDLSSLSTGIYIASIKDSENNSEIKKIIKN